MLLVICQSPQVILCIEGFTPYTQSRWYFSKSEIFEKEVMHNNVRWQHEGKQEQALLQTPEDNGICRLAVLRGYTLIVAMHNKIPI